MTVFQMHSELVYFHVLEKDDLIFNQSLNNTWDAGCGLNEDGLERLLFEIRSNFPNLHTLVIYNNKIKSLLGIEARIKRILSSSSPQIKLPNNNNLCKLRLNGNPIFNDVIIKKRSSIDPTEKAAMSTFLNAFDRISS
mmetsp:Transcript_59655/g.66751  ORF Transcript_59655/g.66751 Transcript_59655/m.66751 type:complete len:138 (-) Transcript_59655:154-567(-)